MRTYRTVRYPLGEALLALYRWRGPLIKRRSRWAWLHLSPGSRGQQIRVRQCRRVQLEPNV